MKKLNFLLIFVFKKLFLCSGCSRGILLIEGAGGVLVMTILLYVAFLIIGYNTAIVTQHRAKIRMIQECQIRACCIAYGGEVKTIKEGENKYFEEVQEELFYIDVPVYFCDGVHIICTFACIHFFLASIKESFMITILKDENNHEDAF